MKKHVMSVPKSIFIATGALLIAWSSAVTTLAITRYGLQYGNYWWFCNIACFGIGVGLVMRSRGVLTGFLSIACFTQIFWLIDNLVRQITGTGPFGLVDFMYRPGYQMDEFLLAHYHYFTMPIAFVALLFLPQKKNYTVPLIAIFNPLIFGVSYFMFPSYQNINCIHRACFTSLSHWEGPVYAFFFWLSVFAIHLMIGYGLNRWLLSIKFTPQMRHWTVSGFATVMALALAFVAHDTHYKMSLPSFACQGSETQDGVRSVCNYTRDHFEGEFMLTYSLQNDSAEDRFCKVGLKMGETVQVLSSGATVSRGSKTQLSALVPSPKHDTQAQLLLKCRPMVRTVGR